MNSDFLPSMRPALAGLGLLLLLAASPAAVQGQRQTDEEAPQDKVELEDEFFDTTSDVGDIDEILQGEEEIFGSIEGYTYDPGERRDPFRSLLVSAEEAGLPGQRPEGVPGLLIDEVNLIGIWRTPRGYVAQVQAADKQKSYALHEGVRLFDGEVVTIEASEVVFRQKVEDPTALKPFRERVKVLNPEE